MEHPSKHTSAKEIHALNSRMSMQQIKKDCKRLFHLFVVSLFVTGLTYRLEICFKESLICLGISFSAVIISNILLKKMQSNGQANE